MINTKFHAFAWPDYEAGGGYADWLDAYDTVEDAKKAVEMAVASGDVNAGQVAMIKDNVPVQFWHYDMGEYGKMKWSEPASLDHPEEVS